MEVFLFVVVALANVIAQDYRIVNIKQGPVKGYKEPGYDVFTFHGIPYATAPQGKDKFKGPLPAPTWTEPFEAVESRIACHQHGQDNNWNGLKFQDDCLVASVYVPNTDATNLPVFFYVHGGAFQMGSSSEIAPFHFIDYQKNIILVTFNYRLGPHGFLCLGTPDVPGNAGMKDQIAALRWVRENIASFGGNPDDITIAGCSAGGASVDLLILSKMTGGMYKNVIGQSGANIGAFAVQFDPTENARGYARVIGYEGPDNLADIEEFYKTISYEQLLSFDLGSTKDVAVVFSACVERDLGIEKFLDDTPINIIKKGNYIRSPMLYGWAEMEGLMQLYMFEIWKNEMNEDFTQFLPADLIFDSVEEKREVAQKVKEFYFGDASVSGDNILGFVDYFSDVMFIVSMQRAATLQVEAGNDKIYMSVFSHVTNDTDAIPYTDNVKGAIHCTQFEALFRTDYSLAPEDVSMRQTMTEVFLNFINTGDPTPDGSIPPSMPKWLPVQEDRTPCMDFGNQIRVVPGPFNADRQKFWDDIYDRYQRQPVAPYDF